MFSHASVIILGALPAFLPTFGFRPRRWQALGSELRNMEPMPDFRLLGQVSHIGPSEFIAVASAVPVEGEEGASVLIAKAASRAEGEELLAGMLSDLRQEVERGGGRIQNV